MGRFVRLIYYYFITKKLLDHLDENLQELPLQTWLNQRPNFVSIFQTLLRWWMLERRHCTYHNLTFFIKKKHSLTVRSIKPWMSYRSVKIFFFPKWLICILFLLAKRLELSNLWYIVGPLLHFLQKVICNLFASLTVCR